MFTVEQTEFEASCTQSIQATYSLLWLRHDSLLSMFHLSLTHTRLSLESCVKLEGLGVRDLAERCSLQSLNISFCYKMNQATVDTLISTLRAKGSLRSLELMGLSVGGLGMEFFASCSSLTRIILGGVKELTDDVLEMVSEYVCV